MDCFFTTWDLSYKANCLKKRKPDRCFMSFYYVALGITQYNLCHILIIKAITKPLSVSTVIKYRLHLLLDTGKILEVHVRPYILLWPCLENSGTVHIWSQQLHFPHTKYSHPSFKPPKFTPHYGISLRFEDQDLTT